MISAIHIEDFKSYRKAELKLAPLTVLIGANASGKSNALEALRFLSWLGQGQKLSSLQYMVNENDRVVRGRIADLPRKGLNRFALGCTVPAAGDYPRLEISFELRYSGQLHIQQETAYDPKGLDTGYNALYKIVHPAEGTRTQVSVEYNNFKRGGKKPQLDCTDQQAIFLQLQTPARFPEGHAKARQTIIHASEVFEGALSNIMFLDPVPQKMRDYSFISERTLSGDGSNLSAVIYNLRTEDERSYQQLLGFISSLPEQHITEIDFLRGPREEVMVQLKETFGGEDRFFDAGLLSDGTLRVLALAAALLSAEEGSLVIIEEVDNGIHPSRAHQLLQTISELARRRNLRVLISTHNPALLNALPDEAVPDVVFCYRNPKDGWSELVRMRDLPDYPELITQDSLGDLLTRGVIDRFVKQYPGADAKKQKALEWLESLK